MGCPLEQPRGHLPPDVNRRASFLSLALTNADGYRLDVQRRTKG